MRVILFFLLSVFFSTIALSEPISLVAQSSISTDGWFPLSEDEIKAAGINTALSELNSNGRFIVVDSNIDPASTSYAGTLQIELFLVNAAELVKLSAKLQLPDCATLFSAASVSVRGMDQQGIFEALKQVGKQVADGLDTSNLADNCAPTTSLASAALFESVRELMQLGGYSEARSILRYIADVTTHGHSRWHSVAVDELRFHLPIAEAETAVRQVAEGDFIAMRAAYAKQEDLYSQAIAANTHDAVRIEAIEIRLDELAINRDTLKKKIWNASVAALQQFRQELQVLHSNSEQWPTEDILRTHLELLAPAFSIVNYRIKDGGMELTVNDSRYADEATFFGDRTDLFFAESDVRPLPPRRSNP